MPVPKEKRLSITLPESQIKWLRELCKKAKLTPSQYIKWLLCRKTEELVLILKCKEWEPAYKSMWLRWTEEELQKIIHAKWIDD